MKPHPKKISLSNLSNTLFCQAQEIKRLKADNKRKDRIILEMQRHAEGIVKAWNKGVISEKEVL